MINSAILPVKDVNQQEYVRRLGRYLKKSGKVQVPEWVDCVKTGYSRELPPNNPDWLYVRMGMLLIIITIIQQQNKSSNLQT